jgi:hypothetical protein
LILALGEAGYEARDIADHARAVNRTPDGAARTIRDWLRAGFRPSPASLTALAATGIPATTVPSRAAVDRLRAKLQGSTAVWSDTDLALLLAEHGTVARAAHAVTDGGRPC